MVVLVFAVVVILSVTKNPILQIIIHKLRSLRHRYSFMRHAVTVFRMTMAIFTFFLILGMIFIHFIRNFFLHEPLIGFTSVIGFIYMFSKKELKTIGLFSLISSILLIIVYQKINPQMDRYMTHLLPFLLIPASIGFVKIIELVILSVTKNPILQIIIH